MVNWKKLRNPEIFQGNKNKKSYFEGWYFKIVDQTGENIYAFIPGIALDKKNNSSHSFIQFLDGKSGEYHYFKYDVDEFKPSHRKFEVYVEKCYFSSQKLRLEIKKDGLNIKGELQLKNIVPWPKTVLSPGIMGFFSYFPMQTKHGIVSMNHDVLGRLEINNNTIFFEKGSKGYIEKDWGTSFPSSWIWMQSNHFSEPELSFLFSVANIPFLGRHFIGFLSAIWHKGDFYNLATYSRAKLRKIQLHEKGVIIIAEDNKYRLEINGIQGQTTDMKAPTSGLMTAHCHESLSSQIHVKFSDKRKKRAIFNDTGKYAGLEIMDNNELET